jgi:dihydroflavonol-4-reductase
MSNEERVLLTGITGFVGLAIASELLTHGFQIRATVRKRDQEQEIRHLLGELATQDNLEFVLADLLSDSGWAEAANGCSYVIHAASPLVLGKIDDENQLIAPAVDGTRRVLDAAKEAGVRRVVLTSTALTVVGHITDRVGGPDDYTPADLPNNTLYTKSKIMAEDVARAFMKANPDGPAITTIHPGVIIGPPLRPDEDSESIALFRGIMNREQPLVPPISFPLADVRDVAKVHVTAMTANDSDNHRYLVSFTEHPQKMIDIADALRANGYSRAPKRVIPWPVLRVVALFNSEIADLVKSVRGRPMQLDTSRTQSDLSWTPIDFEQSVIDTAHALKATS